MLEGNPKISTAPSIAPRFRESGYTPIIRAPVHGRDKNVKRKGTVKWILLTLMAVVAAGFLLGRKIDGTETRRQPAEVTRTAPTTGASPAAPREVWVGVYINQIYEISLKDNAFVVSFYLWFRWKGIPWEDGKPFEPDKTFGIVEGRIESNEEVARKDLPDGFQYSCRKVTARITKFWDVSDYPIDGHTLNIIVEEEDKENHLVRYLADSENSSVSPDIRMPGWRLTKLGSHGGVGGYATNFGDTSLSAGKESRYDRFVYSMQFQRTGLGYFFKTFFGVWIAAFIAFLCFFIKPTDVDPRFGLPVGALFAAIASEYIVASALPDTNLITLADKIHIVGFAAIFVVILQSTVSLWMAESERVEGARKLDRVFRFLLPLLYAAVNAALVIAR